MRSQLKELAGYVIVVFLFLLFNLYLALEASVVTGELHIESQDPSTFEIYYRSGDESFNEKNTIELKTKPEKTHYSFKLPSFSHFTYLRIDPTRDRTPFRIKRLTLRHELYHTVHVVPRDSEISFLNVHQIVNLRQNREKGLSFETSGNDPYFELEVPSALDISFMALICFFNIIGALLAYLLLNQTLLKGKQTHATLIVTIPGYVSQTVIQQFHKLVKKKHPKSQLISTVMERDGFQYSYDIPSISDSMLVSFLEEIKDISDLIHYRVHYNRSCEV